MNSTVSQSKEENTFQGNAIPWEDWGKAAELASLNPYHAHIGGKDYSRQLAGQI